MSKNIAASRLSGGLARRGWIITPDEIQQHRREHADRLVVEDQQALTRQLRAAMNNGQVFLQTAASLDSLAESMEKTWPFPAAFRETPGGPSIPLRLRPVQALPNNCKWMAAIAFCSDVNAFWMAFVPILEPLALFSAGLSVGMGVMYTYYQC